MKKGYIEADFIGSIIIVIVLLFLLVSLAFIQRSGYELTALKDKANNDLFFINLLRTDTPEGPLQDVIIRDVQQYDFVKTQSYINSIMQQAFGEKICWSLSVNDKSVSQTSDCTKGTDAGTDIGKIDARIELPMIKQQVQTIEQGGGTTQYTAGEKIKSYVTNYYIPYDGDFSSWCSAAGHCLTSTQDIKTYYEQAGYPLAAYNNDINNCLNKHYGWCCVPSGDRGFYEEVNCQGSGLVSVDGGYKKTHYSASNLPVEVTKDATIAVLNGQPMYDPASDGYVAKETLACPKEYAGKKLYLDYGETNPWTGCYVCRDSGSGIYIYDDGTVHVDRYVGIGKASLNKAITESPQQPDIYMGCEQADAQDQPETPKVITQSTLNEIEILKLRFTI